MDRPVSHHSRALNEGRRLKAVQGRASARDSASILWSLNEGHRLKAMQGGAWGLPYWLPL